MSDLTPRSNRFERNLFINGNFDFNKRRDVQGGTGYFADRFRTSGLAGGAIGTFAEFQQDMSTDVPFGGGRSLLFTANSLITPDASDPFGIVQAIEGYDIEEYLGEEVTFSIHVKANHVGTYGVGLVLTFANQSITIPAEITQANTWQRFHVTFTMPSSSSIILDNTQAMSMVFEFLETTSFSTSNVGQVESGIKRGIVGQSNFFDTIGNTLQLSKVLLTKGKDKGDNYFVRRGYDRAEEELKCLRYYDQTGTNNNFKIDAPIARMGSMGGALNTLIEFKVPMRTTPTMNLDTSGTSTGLNDGGTVAESVRADGFSYRISPNTSSWSTRLPWTAEAEL